MSEGTNLPALIDRACDRLSEARSSAEVMEARGMAHLALHYAKVTGAANETHADCLRMIVRCEMRMADEIDAGQTRGEVAKPNQPVSQYVRNADIPATLDDLGISRQRLSEWRDTRDAGMPVVEEAIAIALSEGRAPTKADIQRAIEGKPHVAHNSGENEWYTPPAYIAAARAAMGSIDLDPASSLIANRIVQARHFYTIEQNGLKQTWCGNIWLNPPYAQPLVQQFTEAASAKYDAREIRRACVLVNNATETSWFQRVLDSAAAVCLLRSRIRFLDTEGHPSGAPLQGQAVLYLGEEPMRFADSLSSLGRVLFTVPA